MPESCRSAQERQGGVHQLIDRQLHERQQLVQASSVLSGIQAPTPNAEELQHFCQLLLDYISAGHFEVYEQLATGGKAFGGQRGLELAEQIFPRLGAVTESALSFNDRCDNDDCREGACPIAELKVLRQQLHERFELEDCLIEVLRNAHSQSDVEGSAVPI